MEAIVEAECKWRDRKEAAYSVESTAAQRNMDVLEARVLDAERRAADIERVQQELVMMGECCSLPLLMRFFPMKCMKSWPSEPSERSNLDPSTVLLLS